MTKIDKDIPIPKISGRTGCPPKYPFRMMEVGDSFFIAGKSATISGLFLRYMPRKFTCRSVVENDISGVRIWRIE